VQLGRVGYTRKKGCILRKLFGWKHENVWILIQKDNEGSMGKRQGAFLREKISISVVPSYQKKHAKTTKNIETFLG